MGIDCCGFDWLCRYRWILRLALFLTVRNIFAILKTMRILATQLLIISFFGLAVLGFAGMAMAAGHGHSDCIATAVQGAVCPEAPGTVGFINFHAGAVRFFSTAVIGASALMFLLLLSALFYESISDNLRRLLLLLRYRVPQFLLMPAALPSETLNFWLFLHEKRDPAHSFSFRYI